MVNIQQGRPDTVPQNFTIPYLKYKGTHTPSSLMA